MVEFEMIERRICSRFRRRSGEPTFMFGEGVGIKRVLPRQVLRVNESLGAGDPRSKLGRRFARFALAVIGMAGRGEISLRQLGSIRPLAAGDARTEPHAISAGRRAEYSRQTLALKTGERIVLGALVQRRDGANGGRKERDLAWKNVTEQARNTQRHIDPRPAQHGQRQHLEAADASRGHVPGWPAADQCKRLGEIVAAGAHSRRTP